MAAESSYTVYYPENPEILFEYNWQTTMGGMIREIFFHFPFSLSDHLELIITDIPARGLPYFSFWHFSLWDKMLWLCNVICFCCIVFIFFFILGKIIRKLWQYLGVIILFLFEIWEKLEKKRKKE